MTYSISGLNAIIFHLTDKFSDIYYKNNKQETPQRRLNKLRFDLCDFMPVESKLGTGKKLILKPKPIDYNQKEKQLLAEIDQYEIDLNNYIAEKLFSEYDYNYFIEYCNQHPEINQTKFLPCNAINKQCSFLCPIYQPNCTGG